MGVNKNPGSRGPQVITLADGTTLSGGGFRLALALDRIGVRFSVHPRGRGLVAGPKAKLGGYRSRIKTHVRTLLTIARVAAAYRSIAQWAQANVMTEAR